MARGLLAGLMVWFLTGSALEAKEIKLRFSSPFPTVQVTTGKIIKPWIEEINAKGKGRVSIRLYPAGALGKAPDQFDLAEKGIADLSYHLSDYTPGRFPLTTVFSLPFMVQSAEKASAAMWHTFQQEAAYQKEYSKVKVLALFCHPGGHFHTVKKPIHALSDFKGLKIRASNPSVSNALKIWGAVPISMPITETYQSLERNVIDGSVLQWEGLGVFKLDEVTRYSTLAYMYTMPMMIVMNKKKWESLPDDVKQLIDGSTGLSMSIAAGKAFDGVEKPFRERALKKGIKEIILPDTELDKMKTSTMPLRSQWVKDMAAKGYPAQQVLDTALHFLEN